MIALLLSLNVCAQLPTAQSVALQMKVGWNLGNTMEAICGENAWGNPTTSQTLINAVKAAGFNTVRIPCAWKCHTTNGVIDANWLARVKAIVDYCINNNMYAIINIHWDEGWLENNVMSIDNRNEVERIVIFDILGKQVETIQRAAISNVMSMGGSLKPGVYVVEVHGANWLRSFRVVKMK